MKFPVRAVLAACGAAVALTALAAGPAQADTGRVPCPDSILQTPARLPDSIDLVVFDKDKKTFCFSGQSDRAMQVNIYGATQVYKGDKARSVTLRVERTMGDVRTAWERLYLNSDKRGHMYFGSPAHRIDSIYIQK